METIPTNARKCKFQDIHNDFWRVEWMCPKCATILTQYRFPLKTKHIFEKCDECQSQIKIILKDKE